MLRPQRRYRGPVHAPQELPMKWDIAENSRIDIVGYSGINYSGDRYETRIFPSGRQGDEFPGTRIRSMSILGPIGMRVTLKTSLQENWEDFTWRVIRIQEGKVFEANDGRLGVRIPDLDTLNPPDAFRCNPDIEESFQLVERPEDGEGWTFGRRGKATLKQGIMAIRVEKESQFTPRPPRSDDDEAGTPAAEQAAASQTPASEQSEAAATPSEDQVASAEGDPSQA